MTSIILAGGRSSRFGRNKALETIDGESLIQHVVNHLAPLSKEIIIVTAHGGAEAWHCEPFVSRHSDPERSEGEESHTAQDRTREATSPIKIIADIYPNKGPLCGIYSGLMASSNSRAIVVSCDMPFLNTALLEYMTHFSTAFDIIAPRVGKKVEPLCAVYSKNCLVPIYEMLERNELRVSKLLNAVKVKCVEEDEINKFDPGHLSFLNINTQADLNEARKLAIHPHYHSKW